MTYYPSGGPTPAVPPPPHDGAWTPGRVDRVAGTDYGLVQLQVVPAMSGQATGSLIAGIASILVSLLVLCFGAVGAEDGWGVLAAGAFALLSGLLGVGAIVTGVLAMRQIRSSGQGGRLRFKGRGVAVAGCSCGAVGAGIAVLSVAVSALLGAS
ncbi:hypothetical protein [Actinoplanes sp. NPDC051859]|uniref:hypothetical protein n=1 Tax=Actinoplanes sp. NPDC051859 TaxID=3363909 RepID=UPI0037882B1E